MNTRFLLALILCSPSIVSAQVNGRFFLEKRTFAPGEPIFLYFEATNIGTETQNVDHADPYTFCSGYQIQVSGDPDKNLNCALNFTGGSCLSSDYQLTPGKSRTERILLNYEHKVDAIGYYEVKAVKNLAYASGNLYSSPATNNQLQIRETLEFSVDEDAVFDRNAIQSLVSQLKSDDLLVRRDAARALASLAPISLEDLLLSFADDSEFRDWTPLACSLLNTPRSLNALADLLLKSEPGTYEHMKAADLLAKTGDSKWYPLLLDVAQKHANIGSYVDDAAESGAEKMLSTLITMMGDPDGEFVRPNAISALSYTGSRAAVPILIDLLRSPDSDASLRALYGLRQLTHRTIPGDKWFENPQSQYLRWAQWWTRDGVDTPIYKADECKEMNLLP